MGLARILVDGYSLLHEWTALAPGKARHSAAAREELVRQMIQYHDACRVPISVVFDGRGTGTDSVASTPGVEILYSRTGQTADQVIERVSHLMRPYGEVLVVTNDTAERETVRMVGAMTSSCANFVITVSNALGEMNRDVQIHNDREKQRFRTKRPRPPT